MVTACIVIPCHRATLQSFETTALARCVSVLAPHRKVLVAPHGLDLSGITTEHPTLEVERFAPEFFDGIGGYNRLMLSDGFYARFARHEYVLVHQLDAFVFSDQLLAWCRKGYDYVGAPWLPQGPIPNLLQRARNALRRARARRRNEDFAAQYFYAVGNGGFSLRRIAAMREVLADLSHVAERYRNQVDTFWNEDLFFSIEANRSRTRIRAPSYRIAAGFAWELEPEMAAAINGGQLPFGCHAWNKLHPEAWRPIFARIGYSLDEMLGAAPGRETECRVREG